MCKERDREREGEGWREGKMAKEKTNTTLLNFPSGKINYNSNILSGKKKNTTH